MAVTHPDSVEKVIEKYLAAVCREPFTFKGVEYTPMKIIRVSPLIFRKFVCPPKCGACCPVFSLDYLPHESHPENVEVREVKINSQSFRVYSDMQHENKGTHCQYLGDNGNCDIHIVRPLSCDFEILRFSHHKKIGKVDLCQRDFGRGHSLTRYDGTKGSMCELTSVKEMSIEELEREIMSILERLHRLDAWAYYFNIKTHLPHIIEWVERGPYSEPLKIIEERSRQRFL